MEAYLAELTSLLALTLNERFGALRDLQNRAKKDTLITQFERHVVLERISLGFEQIKAEWGQHAERYHEEMHDAMTGPERDRFTSLVDIQRRVSHDENVHRSEKGSIRRQINDLINTVKGDWASNAERYHLRLDELLAALAGGDTSAGILNTWESELEAIQAELPHVDFETIEFKSLQEKCSRAFSAIARARTCAQNYGNFCGNSA